MNSSELCNSKMKANNINDANKNDDSIYRFSAIYSR